MAWNQQTFNSGYQQSLGYMQSLPAGQKQVSSTWPTGSYQPQGNYQQAPPGQQPSTGNYQQPTSFNYQQPPLGNNQQPPPNYRQSSASSYQQTPPCGNQQVTGIYQQQQPMSYQFQSGGVYQQPYNQQYSQQMQFQPGLAGPIQSQRAPPDGIDSTLWGWFLAVDRDNSGAITSDELQQALLNNNWSHFNGETCRLMIGMFDKDRSGTINVYEFAALWKYIQEWKQCFDSFDRDRSGTIDQNELNQAFTSFGYRLSPYFCQLCVRTFDRTGSNTMKFDDFIQCCVMLKTLTDAFRKHDVQQRGVVNVTYEQFLEMVLNNTLAGI
ncbi:programmed cell death protein 6 isoform X1 [Hydra vulgaris]|nr:programmed cell death protein 6 [Hydra vulgaris]